MKNGWTGGQYSVYRFLFGLYLFLHFCALCPWSKELFSHQGMIPDSQLSPLIHLFPNLLALNDSALFVSILNTFGLIASLFFMIGKWDRIAAFILWYILACFFGRNPLIANPSLPCVGWLLLAHLFLPSAPFGSIAAKKRLDPRGNWAMIPSLFWTAWTVMSLAYTYSGIMKLFSPSWLDGSALSYLLQNPLVRTNAMRDLLLLFPTLLLNLMTWGVLALEVLFAPLALFKRIRPWIWSAILLMHLSLLPLLRFADLTWGMILLHCFTFDPAWLKPRPVQKTLLVFYDGACGFCHSFVRFVLSENKYKWTFRFAPLESNPTLDQESLTVLEEGQIYVKSRAIFRIFVSLGGLWKALAIILSWLPTSFSDAVYDAIARIRHRLFARPKEICPILPPELRDYFQ